MKTNLTSKSPGPKPTLAQRVAKVLRAIFNRRFGAASQDQLWGRMVERHRKGTLTPPPVMVIVIEENTGVKERAVRN